MAKQADLKRYYFDASVLLRWINDEPKDQSGIINEIMELSGKGEIEIWTSQISIVEVAFASFEQKQKTLSKSAERRIDTLWHPESVIRLADVSELVAYDARDLIREAVKNGWSLKSHDAVHLATAKRLKVAEFHAYNSGYAKWDVKIGFRVVEPHVFQPKLFSQPAAEAPKRKT